MINIQNPVETYWVTLRRQQYATSVQEYLYDNSNINDELSNIGHSPSYLQILMLIIRIQKFLDTVIQAYKLDRQN